MCEAHGGWGEKSRAGKATEPNPVKGVVMCVSISSSKTLSLGEDCLPLRALGILVKIK